MGVRWQLVFGWFLLVGGFAQNLSTTGLVEEESANKEIPEEDLENIAREEMASLQEAGKDQIHAFANLGLQHFNKQQHSTLFTLVGDATMTVKKAVGTIVCLQLSLVKTNCTKEDVGHLDRFEIMRYIDSGENEQPPKYCAPLPDEQEQLDCRFEIFVNERSYDESVLGHDCKPIHVLDGQSFMKMLT